MTKLPALGERRGSVLFISGGPGSPGIHPFLDYDGTAKAITQHYDIVGYDARGVGQSQPGIRCSDEASAISMGPWWQPWWNPTSSTELAEAKSFVESCIEHTGAAFLRHVGTNAAVRDVESLRQALGEAHLNVVAYSYGTKVAALYAGAFPSHVRAMVLDGVVDLSEDDASMRINQARAMQRAFGRFAAYCAKQSRCPFGDRPDDAVPRYHALLREFENNQSRDGRTEFVPSEALMAAIVGALFWPEQWAALIEALTGVQDGRPEQLQTLIASSTARVSADASVAITCADTAWNMMASGFAWEHTAAINAELPFTEPPEAVQPVDPCGLWPFPGTDVAHMPARRAALPDLLFVAQRGDPTTPHANARRMATFLDSPLITREGDGHTLVLTGLDPCIDAIVVDYLMAPHKRRSDAACRESSSTWD